MIRKPSDRPRMILGALVVIALAATSLTITQCRNISDPAIELKSGSYEPLNQRHKECMQRCDEAYREALKAEFERHRLMMKGCGDDLDCRHTENTRFRHARREIDETRRTCKSACRYNEGAALGGK